MNRYSLSDVPMDGNCFYSVMSLLLNFKGCKNLAYLRNKNALYFIRHIKTYKPFFTQSVEKELVTFLANGQWATHLQMECFCKAFNVCIELWQYPQADIPKRLKLDTPYTLKDMNHLFGKKKIEKLVLNPSGKKRVRVLHVNENHFMAICHVRTATPSIVRVRATRRSP